MDPALGIAAMVTLGLAAGVRALVLCRVRRELGGGVEPEVVLERKEVSDPRGPIAVRLTSTGRIVASCAVQTALSGGPPDQRAAGARTGDRAFDARWAVQRAPLCCTAELRRAIVRARPLEVVIELGRLVVSGQAAWCGEASVVEAARAIRAALPRTELDGLRIAAVDDPEPAVRVPAWDALHRVDREAGTAAVTAGLWAGHPRIRLEAARRLGNDDVLLQVLADDSVEVGVRRAALRALGTPGVLVAGVDVALASPHEALRRVGLERLARLDGSRALESALLPWRTGAVVTWACTSQEALARVTRRLVSTCSPADLGEVLRLVPRLRRMRRAGAALAARIDGVLHAIRERAGGGGALSLADVGGGELAIAEGAPGWLSPAS